MLVTVSGFAQVTESEFTLAQAQAYAVKNSFATKSAHYDAEVADKATRELLATGFPQIEGSLQYLSYIRVPDIIIPAGAFGPEEIRTQFQQPENLTMGITASQLLFNGTWLVGLEASKAYADLQNKNIEKSEVSVKDQVSQSYFLALVSSENVRILRESRDALAKTAQQTEASYTSGFLEKQDVDQLTLSLNELEIQLSYAEEQQKLGMDLLKLQMGFPLAQEIKLTDTVDGLMAADAVALLQTPLNVKAAIDYEVALGGLTMSQLNVKAKKSAYLPSLAGFITFQTQAQRSQFNFFDPARPYLYGNFFGVQLNVPVLSGGQRKYAVQKAEVEVRRMQDLLVFTEQSAELEYRSARLELNNAVKLYDSGKKSLELAREIFRTSEIKYNEGLSTSFDVTQRNTQVITAQGAYVQAMLKFLQARNRLTKALDQY